MPLILIYIHEKGVHDVPTLNGHHSQLRLSLNDALMQSLG